MIAALDQIATLAPLLLQQGLVVFLRVGAAMAVLPAFGEKSVPARVRLFLSLAFTMIVAPGVMADIGTTPPLQPLVYISEPVIGLGFGIAIRLMIMALQVAGSIAAQSTSLAQLIGGANADPQPAIGHVLVVAGLALAVMLGLHVKLATGLILTYRVFPIGQFPDTQAFADWGIVQIARAFSLAFTLAAPFVIASLLYNVALGVINRAMPQLMVAFVGAPAITAGGLILLLLTAPLLLPVWQAALETILANPFGGR
ncbi:flagellar biosynthetic protein FliR [Aliiroseovarius sediminilitoris]|uniref:Flagellar biosynthetic protein FliR n=1 Tax=Aliiroseovarius sediminilitoris TaxID=1173584 RepID=A0A1I0NGF9_9RHOB|nr:flagellar biosynthetic protein FliR [Aliiroseovarius sediminilitoris]SEW00578.1 flagellar biosynthetic protein FliR [Aliiroseovarius sediminilitoris]